MGACGAGAGRPGLAARRAVPEVAGRRPHSGPRRGASPPGQPEPTVGSHQPPRPRGHTARRGWGGFGEESPRGGLRTFLIVWVTALRLQKAGFQVAGFIGFKDFKTLQHHLFQ